MAGAGSASVTSATYRQFAHLSVGGSAVRVRLSNSSGKSPLVFRTAAVGIRSQGAALVAGSSRPLTRGGARTITVPAGEVAYSDPVSLQVLPQQDLAVSLYADGSPAVTQHPSAFVTEYVTASGAGDHSDDTDSTAFTGSMASVFWLDTVDVLTTEARGTVVALGDSITDGANSTMDANNRWTDVLARRFEALPDGDLRRRAVVNAGIGGGTLCGVERDDIGANGLRRLADVMAQSGATDVIVFMGTNDIFSGNPPFGTGGDAANIIKCMRTAITAIHGHGLRAIGATIIPRNGGELWIPPTEDPIRQQVNDWIRTSGAFDAFIDFDAITRWDLYPNIMQPQYELGSDGTHPNAAGHAAMGSGVDLAMFDGAPPNALPEMPVSPVLLLPLALSGVALILRRQAVRRTQTAA